MTFQSKLKPAWKYTIDLKNLFDKYNELLKKPKKNLEYFFNLPNNLKLNKQNLDFLVNNLKKLKDNIKASDKILLLARNPENKIEGNYGITYTYNFHDYNNELFPNNTIELRSTFPHHIREILDIIDLRNKTDKDFNSIDFYHSKNLNPFKNYKDYKDYLENTKGFNYGKFIFKKNWLINNTYFNRINDEYIKTKNPIYFGNYYDMTTFWGQNILDGIGLSNLNFLINNNINKTIKGLV